MDESVTAHSNIQAEQVRKTRLGFFPKVAYGTGSLVDGIITTAVNGFLFFYMTAVCGLSGALAGGSLVVALLIDSVADPLIGSLSDNLQTRFGRRHPWMFVSALPLAIFAGLLFSVPPALTDWSLFAYMTVVAIGLRVSLSLFNVPYISLGAELSDDYVERSNIVGYRAVFTIIATLAAQLLIYRVFMPTTSAILHREAYVPFGWVCAGIAFTAALGSTFGTRETLSRLHSVTTKSKATIGRFAAEMAEIFGNRHFVILFAGSLLYFIAAGIANTLNLHNAKFFWGLSNGTLQMLGLAAAAGSVVGIPVTSILQRYIDKHILLQITLVVICGGSALVPIFRILDVTPASGLGLLVPLLILNAANGTAQIVIAICYYSMTADAADEHEYLYHARREGLFFAGLSFSSKAASALGAFVAGQAIDLIGFPGAIAERDPSLHIAHRTVIELALITGPGTAVIAVLPALLVLLIRFNRKDLVRIQDALSERRKTKAQDETIHAVFAPSAAEGGGLVPAVAPIVAASQSGD
jgi:GPH family glycoside/pentoside/hexuronide:cation symporter